MGSGSHRSGESWFGKRLRAILHAYALTVQPEADALDKISGRISAMTRQMRARAITSQHMPTEHCSEMHCHIHDSDELAEPGDFKSCFECGHIFRTQDELLSAHNRLMVEMGLFAAVTTDDVTACPFCYHDF